MPNDTTVSCDDPYLMVSPTTVTATDNCGVTMIPLLITDDSDQEMNGSCGEYRYNIIRTWTVTDDCGNETTAQQVVSVNDLAGPTFTEPDDITIDCNDDEMDRSITGDVTDAVDACSGEVTIEFTDTKMLGGCPNDTIITRKWQAIDACGNATTRQQIITKKDQTVPTFTPPNDTIVDCSVGEDPSITGVPTNLQDDCGNGINVLEPIDDIIRDPFLSNQLSCRKIMDCRRCLWK